MFATLTYCCESFFYADAFSKIRQLGNNWVIG